MEPNDNQHDDLQLRELLREWQVAPASDSLQERVLQPRLGWWSFLLRGYIRVPVPVACFLALLLAFSAWRWSIKPAQNAPCTAERVVQNHCHDTVARTC